LLCLTLNSKKNLIKKNCSRFCGSWTKPYI
jgi:hypothetical protein